MEDTVRLGSRWYWLFVRLFQLVWTFGAILVITLPPDAVQPKASVWSDLLFTVGIAFLTIKAHPIAYGRADANGVSFRRYLRLQRLDWEEFSGVEWQHSNIVLTFRQSRFLDKGLEFRVEPSSLWQAFRFAAGKDPPEAIHWLRRQIESFATIAPSSQPKVT